MSFMIFKTAICLDYMLLTDHSVLLVVEGGAGGGMHCNGSCSEEGGDGVNVLL